MAAFATYSVGFFARPLGGVVFGHYGDRVGRKSVLVITLVLMGVSTFLVGALPTYDSIGMAAPILLVALRFAQGFGVGGEWGGAVLMAVEHSPKGKRGLAAGWTQAGVPAGLLLSSAVFAAFAALPEPQFLSWGWRCPFLIGILLVGVGLFIRLRVMESPIFATLQETKRTARLPIVEVLRSHPKNVLLAMGARFAENVSFYIFSVFILSYAAERLKVSKSLALQAISIAAVVEFVTIPAFGALSDRIGRRPVYMVGAALTGLLAFPFFWLVDTGTAWGMITATVLGLGVAHAAMYGPQAAFFSELFGTSVRCTGASLGYQLASPLAGGLAPLIASWLLQQTHGEPWSVALYVVGACLLTLLSVFLAAETSRSDL
jgi:MHS family shikimate/dehydroshikimate transporter-like MFS transporter